MSIMEFIEMCQGLADTPGFVIRVDNDAIQAVIHQWDDNGDETRYDVLASLDMRPEEALVGALQRLGLPAEEV